MGWCQHSGSHGAPSAPSAPAPSPAPRAVGWRQEALCGSAELVPKGQPHVRVAGIFGCRAETLLGQWRHRSPVNTPAPPAPGPAHGRGVRADRTRTPVVCSSVCSHLRSEGWSRGSPLSVCVWEYLPSLQPTSCGGGLIPGGSCSASSTGSIVFAELVKHHS